jgi:regulator of nonsense transcripts 3
MPQAPAPGANGVLSVPAGALQKGNHSKEQPTSKKAPAPRLKVVLRRLAPALTQTELESALGEEWQVGGGKVDWLEYKPGKASKK